MSLSRNYYSGRDHHDVSGTDSPYREPVIYMTAQVLHYSRYGYSQCDLEIALGKCNLRVFTMVECWLGRK
jgi:hypothetical protein